MGSRLFDEGVALLVPNHSQTVLRVVGVDLKGYAINGIRRTRTG